MPGWLRKCEADAGKLRFLQIISIIIYKVFLWGNTGSKQLLPICHLMSIRKIFKAAKICI